VRLGTRWLSRAKTNIDPVGPLAEVEMRKKRGALKDELHQMLTA